MPKFNVKSPIKHDGEIVRSGEIELSNKAAAAAVARGELEPIVERAAKAEKTEKPAKVGDGKDADGKAPETK